MLDKKYTHLDFIRTAVSVFCCDAVCAHYSADTCTECI